VGRAPLHEVEDIAFRPKFEIGMGGVPDRIRIIGQFPFIFMKEKIRNFLIEELASLLLGHLDRGIFLDHVAEFVHCLARKSEWLMFLKTLKHAIEVSQ